ncbi:MAG: RluA family pseudouridine synthase [Pseudomonadota bacterium]
MTETGDSVYYPTHKLAVPEDAVGQRIDNFLLHYWKGVPRSRVYRVLRKGEVRVNGGRKKPLYKLKSGDELRLPPVRIEPQGEATVPPGAWRELAARILFEDDDLLALDKPAGMAAHAGSGVPFGVAEAFHQHHRQGRRVELIHRLDRETSGCLLLGKGRSVVSDLQDAFRQRTADKAYCALLSGRLDEPRSVNKSLEKTSRGGEAMVEVSEAGKAAHSDFYPQAHYRMGNRELTLARVVIHTGRTHQIRVHARALGMPLVGDDKYGDDAINREARRLGLSRLFLHSARLAIPFAGETRVFEAPLDGALQQWLDGLERSE